jgi:hypothetical protein
VYSSLYFRYKCVCVCETQCWNVFIGCKHVFRIEKSCVSEFLHRVLLGNFSPTFRKKTPLSSAALRIKAVRSYENLWQTIHNYTAQQTRRTATSTVTRWEPKNLCFHIVKFIFFIITYLRIFVVFCWFTVKYCNNYIFICCVCWFTVKYCNN